MKIVSRDERVAHETICMILYSIKLRFYWFFDALCKNTAGGTIEVVGLASYTGAARGRGTKLS